MWLRAQSSMAWSQTFANITGCPSEGQSDAEVLACVRSLSLDAVMGPSLSYNYSGYFPLMFPSMPWGATIDGVLLKDRPFNVIANGEMNDVASVIMGTNHDEGTIFATRLKSVVPAMHKPLQPGDMDFLLDHFFGQNETVNAIVDAAYPQSAFPNTTVQIEVMLRDFFFLCPSSRAMLALGSYGVPVYLYQFNYIGDWIEVRPAQGGRSTTRRNSRQSLQCSRNVRLCAADVASRLVVCFLHSFLSAVRIRLWVSTIPLSSSSYSTTPGRPSFTRSALAIRPWLTHSATTGPTRSNTATRTVPMAQAIPHR